MERSTDRILTTHCGSLPRPPALAEALVRRDRAKRPGGEIARGELPGSEAGTFHDLVHEAVTTIVRSQREVGLDVVNDGEMSKFSYATYVKERLAGFGGHGQIFGLADLADFPDFARRISLDVTTPACTGPVAFQGAEAVQVDIENLTAAVEATPASEAFMSAASPGIISLYLPNQYYDSDAAYLYALADAMKPEYDAIAAAGHLLQLDCPDLAAGRHFRVPPFGVEEFRKKMDLHVAALNHAVRDIPPERLRMHVCWGNYESPHHHDVELRDIVDIILGARPAAILLEAANPRHEHEWQVFEDVALPDGKVLVPGVIDTRTNYIEHPELVAQRILRYANLVGRENVIAGADCGFATFANFLTVDPAIAWRKLGSLVEGAELASKRLW